MVFFFGVYFSPIKASVMNTLTMGCFVSSVAVLASTLNTYISSSSALSFRPSSWGIFLDLEQRNGMAQNAEQEGWGVEHQNLDKKLKVEQDMERIVGLAETAWGKAAVGNKTETETNKTTAQMEKKIVETQKRTVGTEKTVEGTRKTAVVNEKTEWGSLYQNRRNTRQTDGRMILYNLKKKKLNQEQEQELVH
jgi:hypothetical protein